MEDVYKTFILQVKTWLEKNNLEDADRHVVYQFFVGQCEQYGIAEEDFYVEVLRPAYQDAVFNVNDLEIPNIKGTQVTIFGVKSQNLRMLGKVLFDNESKSTTYFEDMSLIKSHVDTLESGDAALEYAALYREEPNHEKRYLKIVYHLNPRLPYRIGNKQYEHITQILDDSFQDQALYMLVYSDFASGKLGIWLNESDPEQAAKISGGKSYNSFLRFVYRINVANPFYLGSNLYLSPADLVSKAMNSLDIRKEIYESIGNEQLFTWLVCIGLSDWQIQYNSAIERPSVSKLKGENLINASVHKLLRIINPEIPAPKLAFSESKISYTQLEASKLLAVPLKVELLNSGFVYLDIKLDSRIDGISLTRSQAVFFDLEAMQSVDLQLLVNPMVLTKDELYNFNLVITTDYETLTIPVETKTVFPMKAFLTIMAKYAAIGFGVLGFTRFALQFFARKKGWLPSELIVADLDSALPTNYPIYLILFLLFVILMVSSYFLIRKTEKI